MEGVNGLPKFRMDYDRTNAQISKFLQIVPGIKHTKLTGGVSKIQAIRKLTEINRFGTRPSFSLCPASFELLLFCRFGVLKRICVCVCVDLFREK